MLRGETTGLVLLSGPEVWGESVMAADERGMLSPGEGRSAGIAFLLGFA